MSFAVALLALMTSAILSAPPALASLYCTRPVANTVYKAGEKASIIWIDDGKAPLLADMPKLQLDLHNPDNTLAKTFSKDVDPKSKKFEVLLSPTLGKNSSGYYFRFHGGNSDVYTARFTITGVTGGDSDATPAPVVASTSAAAVPAAAQNAATAASPNPLATAMAGSPRANVTPALNEAEAARPTPKNLIPTVPPVSTAFTITAPSATLVPHTVITSVANGASSLFDFDMETLKFRIVFILWPALMGISLAL
ncbi:hypothetical protein K488DRAFT_85238 [Vararia minispora EC-137]|uniref:Uncharacterized protein n=1 Tax=Vararia minispora EC-137 TaxID=1314806 RepID=A0ACB8QN24_9AGAM|nr:hypothetical protein K488DRAFT_85238 [Vararia minispora EC-137]